MVKSPPGNAGDTGRISGPGSSHASWDDLARRPQLLSPPCGGLNRSGWAHVPGPALPHGGSYCNEKSAQLVKGKAKSLSRPTPCDPMDCSPLLSPWHFSGKNAGAGCHFLPQGIFPAQGSNPGLPHCTQTLYPLSHQGSPYNERTRESLGTTTETQRSQKQTNKQTKTPQKTNLLTSKKGSPTSKKLSIKKKLQINNCKSGDKDILTLGLWFILPFKKWFINYSHCCLLLFSHCHVWVFAPPWIVARLLCPWGFPSKNTGVGYHFLLQGIFLSQELNLHWRVDSLPQTTWEAPINYSCVRMHSVLPSNPTLGHPVDCSPPGSSVHGILQARTLEWVTTPSSRASSPPRDWTQISCVYCIAGRPYTAEPPGKPKLFTVLYKYEVITGMTLQLYYELGLFSKGKNLHFPISTTR